MVTEALSLAGASHSCGGTFELVREPADIQIRGTTVRVDRDLFRCSGCGADRLTLEQIDAARQAAAEKLRLQEGIMAPEEIRDLRNSLGLRRLRKVGELLIEPVLFVLFMWLLFALQARRAG